MKKRLCLIAALALCLTACGKKEKPVETTAAIETMAPVETTVAAEQETEPVVEEIIEKDHQLNVKFDLNKLQEVKDGKELIKTEYTPIKIVDAEFENLNNALESYNNLTWTEMKDLHDETIEWINSENVKTDGGFYISKRINATRADNKILSFINIENAYLGGAHDSFYISSETFDSKTGETLKINDIVTNYDKIYNMILEYINNNYEKELLFEEYEETLHNMFYRADENDMEVEWTLSYKDLTIYFSPYTLGPWSSGSFIVNIPIEGNEELFVSEYAYDVKYPIEKVYLNTPVKIGDEESKTMLELTATANTEEFKSAIYIRKYEELKEEPEEEIKEDDNKKKNNNEKENEDENIGEIYTEEFGGIYQDSYLVYTRFGKPFLYVEFVHENDYRTLEIFDLSEDSKNPLHISHVKSLDAGIYNNYIADPEDFKLYSRVYLLGTYMGYKSYNSGRNGIPETEDELFTLIGKNELTTKKEIDVLIYKDGNSNIINKETLSSETKLKLLRTDGKTMVEAELEDGRICKIMIEKYDNVCYVNGMSEYSVFKDLPYAG